MSAPRVKSPRALFLSFFLPVLSLVRPRRRLSLAPTAGCCRRRAQGVSRLAAFQRPPSGLGLYTTEHDGRLDGFGRLTPVLLLIRHRVSARYSDHECGFRQVLLRSPWRVPFNSNSWARFFSVSLHVVGLSSRSCSIVAICCWTSPSRSISRLIS